MNLLDYLATEFATFDEKPFNPVDSAILSQFCMVRAEGIVPALRERKSFLDVGTLVQNLLSPARDEVRFVDLLRAERYGDMFTGLDPANVKDNLLALAASPRFRDMRVRDYLSLFDTERQTQFAAVTFVYKKDFAYVGFRGTDTSFTGWRENFNMVYNAPVPAQEQAVRYLEAVAPRLPKCLFVGGHSKGGNLAMYAALRANPAVQDRIERVFTHDGPGFKAGMVSSEEYAAIRDRVHKTVPQDSVVGMLMDSPADLDLRVVHSSEKGVMQHSVFSWDVDGDDFAYVEGLTDGARFTDAVVTQWLARFSDEEAAVVVDALFQALEASGARDATEVLMGGPKSIALLGEAAKNIDDDARDVLTGALGSLAEVAAREATSGLLQWIAPKAKG
ncbi:Mbeg1-like protein [Arabiibacter massiliensis]|uniref:Mbeg1-like protein n=1 Tax=Arabiibacter massiliensis TaxID=1870985 RepID=UPI0009BBE4EB|nr:Mbeg1-like protein [Arabiibacter massiliensis]